VVDSPPPSFPSSAVRASPKSTVEPPLREDRDQHFEALRPACIGRQKRRRKADALRTLADVVAHPRTAHGHRPDAGFAAIISLMRTVLRFVSSKGALG
jgi:hypothetical protein